MSQCFKTDDSSQELKSLFSLYDFPSAPQHGARILTGLIISAVSFAQELLLLFAARLCGSYQAIRFQPRKLSCLDTFLLLQKVTG